MKQEYGLARAKTKAMIAGDHYRFTVLTERMLRMEYSESGVFRDQATQTVVCRDFDLPPFTVDENRERLEITTSSFHVYYDRQPFHENGLEIKMQNNPYLKKLSTWYYGDHAFEKNGNLKGTTSTLDNANGDVYYALDDVIVTGIPVEKVDLGDGVLSKNGFSVIDDSNSLVFGEDGWLYPAQEGYKDLYFLHYGRDYFGCLRDFYQLTGKAPMLPRFCLGNWWSRYYAYTQEQYLTLMERFENEGIPFSVSVMDMDWHQTKIEGTCEKGWTGYTWNRELFPDPKGMMEIIHRMGKHFSLNVHPADGVRAYEEAYPEMADTLDINKELGMPIPFDMTDPRFVEAYFRYLHHPNEDDGVDFWWIDWQQGKGSRKKGYDPLWLLNHFHYLDNARGGKRPLILSRYAGLGSHRYPIGFSGSTFISWDSLRFQPYFTACASNVGYGWWSHDVGGHRNGTRDDELAARWIQYAVFSPILRLHSSDEVFTGKEPWKYEKAVEMVMVDYLRFRHQLIPYIYTMNYRQMVQGEPLIRPLYYHYPDAQESYTLPNEYFFGTDLLVSPITEPMDRESRTGAAQTWLPPGRWVDIFSGLRYEGNRTIVTRRGLEDIPVFAKLGSVIPLEDKAEISNQVENPAVFEVMAFAGDSGTFSLYEDDGVTMGYEEGKLVRTVFTFLWEETRKMLRVDRAEGDLSLIPDKRDYTFVIYGLSDRNVDTILVDGKVLEEKNDLSSAICFDKKRNAARVTIHGVPSDSSIEIVFRLDASLLENEIGDKVYDALNRAQIPFALKERAYKIMTDEEVFSQKITTLHALSLGESVEEVLIELLSVAGETGKVKF